MPGLTPRDMNGHEYDRGPRGPYAGMNGAADPYREEYYRDDPYRRDDGVDEVYRRVVKNGRPMNDRFPTDYMPDPGRMIESRDNPTFEADHLATFQSNEPNGSLHPTDGLRKLRYMENNAGIWTMRCNMCIERKFLVILDYSTGEELERFPISMVQDPTAIFKNDKREIYNNLILFSVTEDPKRRNAQSDMHIFQAISCPAQEIVDEILASKEGRPRISGHRIPPPPMGPAPEPPGPSREAYEYRAMGGASFIGGGPPRNIVNRPRDDLVQNEALERDVQLLNHCFDDVEKFVARLQQAAEAYKELEKRKKDRKGKNKKSGDGMLSHRARPPPGSDFIDIFQKFKLSFNLLAKLKAHIHDPNAPELVHFLFTPLSLIFEASRDPVHGGQNLANEAVAPLLTTEAKQLLLNCLTSKEQDMWQSLGHNWTISRDEWKGFIPPYQPRFYDGWKPTVSVVDDGMTATPRTDPGLDPVIMRRPVEVIDRRSFPVEEDRFPMDAGRFNDARFEEYRRDFDVRPSPRPPSPRNPMPMANPRVPAYPEYPEQRNYQPRREPSPPPAAPARPKTRQEENQAFAQRLKMKNVAIYEVQHERQGKNQKELTVQKGDILEVLDSSRNWWKVRNFRDEDGFAPYTILKEIKSHEIDGGERFAGSEPRDRSSGAYTTQVMERSSGLYNTQIMDQHTPPLTVPAPPPAPSPTAAILASEAMGRRNQRREEDRAPTPPSTKDRAPLPGRKPSPRPTDAIYVNISAREKEPRERTPHDYLHDELRAKMSGAAYQAPPALSRPRPPVPHLTPLSSTKDVTQWLEQKGFSAYCVEMYGYYTGRQLLEVSRQELDRVLSPNEAARLEDNLSLQRNRCGVQALRENAELQSILHRRKAAVDTSGQSDVALGLPPSFRPVTPSSLDEDDTDSEGSANDLANTGKTLRDLLIRQRKKIVNKDMFARRLSQDY